MASKRFFCEYINVTYCLAGLMLMEKRGWQRLGSAKKRVLIHEATTTSLL
ncbi:hypothetical protein D791_02012 [Nitrincola nitratireducens]|uniref:Uncharacterized protein n=1 Tax=Nitrincola nitratireducens TaxID=1229521 RepID=W9VL10_9GAMM|nr:hypothetical protein D791_02012 [Nitrincola nitratireducens]